MADWWERAKEMRERKGLTGVQMAAAIGISPQRVSDYEAGRYKNVTLQTLENVAAALGITAAELLGTNVPSDTKKSSGATYPVMGSAVSSPIYPGSKERHESSELRFAYVRLKTLLEDIQNQIADVIHEVEQQYPAVLRPGTKSPGQKRQHRR